MGGGSDKRARALAPRPSRATRHTPPPAPPRPRHRRRAAAPRRHTPGRKDPPLSEARLDELNSELSARLRRDAAASRESGACSGRGIKTAPMPWKGKTPHGDQPACHCLPGWFGEQCEHGPGHPALPEFKQFCVCARRGCPLSLSAARSVCI